MKQLTHEAAQPFFSWCCCPEAWLFGRAEDVTGAAHQGWQNSRTGSNTRTKNKANHQHDIMFCKGCGFDFFEFCQSLALQWYSIEQFIIKRCRWPVTSAGNNETGTMATYGTTGQPFEPTPAICKQVSALVWSMLDATWWNQNCLGAAIGEKKGENKAHSDSMGTPPRWATWSPKLRHPTGKSP